MRVLLISLLLVPFGLISAQQKGVQFVTELNWQQVKQKAKDENKLIFVDCFATWCLPCKKMDKEIYLNDTVGNLVNDKFISVKVQFDSTGNDDFMVRSWYETSRLMQEKYRLKGFPSFLFFTFDGDLIHRDFGYKNVNSFIKLISCASDPKRKDLYLLLNNYKQGVKDYASFPELVEFAKEIAAEPELAKAIVFDYKINVLEKMNENQLLKKENIEFIMRNGLINSSKDKIFRLLYDNPKKIDSILNREGYAKAIVQRIIVEEDIESKLWMHNKPYSKNPKWEKLRIEITRKYDEKIAKVLLRDYQLSFYKRIGNWRKFAKLFEKKMFEIPPRIDGKTYDAYFGDAWGLNGEAWSVFLNCLDRTVLLKAVNWIDLSIKLIEEKTPGHPSTQVLDTKANLLYKLGCTNEAILLEERAIELDNAAARKKGQDIGNAAQHDFYPTIAKMKRGQPTWLLSDKKDSQK